MNGGAGGNDHGNPPRRRSSTPRPFGQQERSNTRELESLRAANRAADARLRDARLCRHAIGRRGGAILVGQGRLHVLPRQDERARRMTAPEPVLIGAAPAGTSPTRQYRELQLETTGMGAGSGPQHSLNAIPRTGSNVFRGGVDGFTRTPTCRARISDDGLRSFGFNSMPQVQRNYRAGAQLGGRSPGQAVVLRAGGRWGSRSSSRCVLQRASGKVGNPVTATLFYRPHLQSSGGQLRLVQKSFARTTWQASSRQRVNFYFDIQKSCRVHDGSVHRRRTR